MMEQEEEISLPYSEEKQNAILGWLFINEGFFKTAYQRIQPNWFLKTRNAHAFKLLIDAYKYYNYYPSNAELTAFGPFQALEPKERQQILVTIELARQLTQQYRLESLRKELTEWLHSVLLIEGSRKAMFEYNKRNISGCYKAFQDTYKEVSIATFEGR
jgi:hypothetical protein